jgi:glycosyltransferase involved in cell wall biosynthesis
VATRVGGTPDVIRDGIDGFLVDVGDADALSGRLAEPAADPERRARMVRRDGTRARARYTVERLVDDLDVLYRSLLDARAG